MKAKELGPFWLREAAKDMRSMARKYRASAYDGLLREVCDDVAMAYDRAANALSVDALALEQRLAERDGAFGDEVTPSEREAVKPKPLRNLSTPEAREWWRRVEETARIVATWPDWKKGGINVVQPGICDDK